MAFILSRSQQTTRQRSQSRYSNWTAMNQSLISHTEGKTEVGYMPLLNAPEDSYDTLSIKCPHAIHVANQLGINYTIIVIDQALYCKAIWAQVVCPWLQASNFETWWTIGDYVAGNGLRDAWVRAGVIGPQKTREIIQGWIEAPQVDLPSPLANFHSSDACFLSDTKYWSPSWSD